MISEHDIQDAVLEHLREIAVVKRAMLQAAIHIAGDFPSDAGLIIRAMKSLTMSADKLLGDTSVTGHVPP